MLEMISLGRGCADLLRQGLMKEILFPGRKSLRSEMDVGFEDWIFILLSPVSFFLSQVWNFISIYMGEFCKDFGASGTFLLVFSEEF